LRVTIAVLSRIEDLYRAAHQAAWLSIRRALRDLNMQQIREQYPLPLEILQPGEILKHIPVIKGSKTDKVENRYNCFIYNKLCLPEA
jgi:hypothetical protein